LPQDAFSNDFTYNAIGSTNHGNRTKILINNYKNHLGLFCILIIIGVFLVGLWPYDFFPKNGVEWLEETNGINIKERGIVYSSNIFNDRREPFFRNDEITIEVWLESRIKPMGYLAWILSLVDGTGNEYLTLAQWNTNLYIVRERITDPTLSDSTKKLGMRKLLSAGKRRFITVSSSKNGTAVYIDGTLKKIDSNFIFIDHIREGSVKFLLGNSPRGDGQWMGNVLGLAIYDRSMGKEEVQHNYQSWLAHGSPSDSIKESSTAIFLFDEHEGSRAKNHGLLQYDLIIPHAYRVIKRGILETPRLNLRQNLYKIDTILHFLGFIPVSFFLCAFFCYSNRRSMVTSIISTIFISIGLGVSIELLQVYLPSRDSQSLDLICNFLGTMTGIAIFGALSYFRKKNIHEQKNIGGRSPSI
jgi:VanZ family protein